MPGTGYDTDAERVGSLRTRPWSLRQRLIVFGAFAASIAVGAALAAAVGRCLAPAAEATHLPTK